MDTATPLSQGAKKTLRVLVVDDEAIVRNDIRNLIRWEDYGYQLAREAENGQEALALLEETDIDIVIADIEMPVMNGLELAAQVLSRTRAVKFIFLTAYDNCEFARLSMRLGVDSYILKHEISAKVLLNELERMRRGLERISYQKTACINEAMHSVFETSRPPEECRKLFQERGVEFRGGSTFLLRVEIPRGESREAVRNAVAETVERAVNRSETAGSTVFSIEESSVGAMVVMDEGAMRQANPELCAASCVNHVQEQLRAILGAPFYILASPVIASEAQLYQTYRRLREATVKIYFTASPQIIFCRQEPAEPALCDEEVSQLCGALRKRQLQLSEEYLSQLFTQRFPELRDMALLKKYLLSITSQLAEVWNSEQDGGEPEPMDPILLYQELLGLDNVFAAYRRLCELLSELRDAQSEKGQERLQKIRSYVESHYAEDISLKSLGNLIGVSEAYMSQLFKQQFGVSFKTYLKDFRMKKAEEMLLAGNHPIHDIGERVGYRSTAYFCLVFKRHFGVTPGEFIRRYPQ